MLDGRQVCGHAEERVHPGRQGRRVAEGYGLLFVDRPAGRHHRRRRPGHRCGRLPADASHAQEKERRRCQDGEEGEDHEGCSREAEGGEGVIRVDTV